MTLLRTEVHPEASAATLKCIDSLKCAGFINWLLMALPYEDIMMTGHAFGANYAAMTLGTLLTASFASAEALSDTLV